MLILRVECTLTNNFSHQSIFDPHADVSSPSKVAFS